MPKKSYLKEQQIIIEKLISQIRDIAEQDLTNTEKLEKMSYLLDEIVVHQEMFNKYVNDGIKQIKNLIENKN